MNYEEKCHLLMQCKIKKIKQRELAQSIGKSSSWISQFFSDKVDLAESDLEIIKNYINNK